ncbi:transcriptional regulator [Robertmurraya siralis]|uniref:Transcriptional regulator n=1 Tax=Robertmurraya siralis TaxID=77777 RepID=A0A919WHT9_9BACI|nr:helix-turn-helix transcriptional regulator [Robertmurraya siralis]GIN62019.1 transcriptional regulator [Robertmurraya siralis]
MGSIGDNIKLYRERANMSQEELAVKIRVGTSRIEKYETGQHIPTKATLLKISTVLDVPAAELLQNNDEMNGTIFEQV